MQRNPTSQQGFSLIEMIVSLGVFAVVVTIAVGSLLVLISSNRQVQDEQSTLSSVTFALDAMTREIRTGTHYFCHSADVPNATNEDQLFLPTFDIENLSTVASSTRNCRDGNSGDERYHGIVFVEAGDSITGAGSGRILYYYDSVAQNIFRRVGGQTGIANVLPMISDTVTVLDAQFFVTGSDKLVGDAATDTIQPAVTIVLEAEAIDGGEPYTIQTTVTQRQLDL